MEIDPTKTYAMPLAAGPIFNVDDPPRYKYTHMEGLLVQYRTDPDAITSLLPDCYQVGRKPLVTFGFTHSDGVDFLAGRRYSLATVVVAARFDGERDHEEGNYVVVMFENDTLAIIGGREYLGVPKIYADISPIITAPKNGHLRCEVSLWGHLLCGIKVPALKEQNAVVRGIANRTKSPPYLCYKYIAAADGSVDVSYPTLWRMDTTIDQLWLGESAEVYFGTVDEEDVSFYARLIKALAALPVREVTQVARTRGSAVLDYSKYRRLR